MAMNDVLAVTVFIEVSFVFERLTGSDQYLFPCFSFFVFRFSFYVRLGYERGRTQNGRRFATDVDRRQDGSDGMPMVVWQWQWR